jgi:NitT/TauT family transport system ATP-binding protein
MNNGIGNVVLADVSKRFGAKEVLSHLDLTIEPGRFTALVGPSGCGKSTLINLIAGYEEADSGSVSMDGRPVRSPDRDRLVVFQETALFPWKTTLENVMFGPLSRGVPRADAERESVELLATFGLRGFEDRLPEQLSGGMQRRAELARAMINKPSVMLLDEPFRGLDALTRELMQEYLLKIFDRMPVTTLFVTSEVDEAIYLADRVIVLSHRPTRVREVFDVAFARPRSVGMLSHPSFGTLYGDIMSCLGHEVTL